MSAATDHGNEGVERDPNVPGPSGENAMEEEIIAQGNVSEQAARLLPDPINQDAAHTEDPQETEDAAEGRMRRRGRSRARRRFEGCLRRLRLCPCVVQECMGNQRTCRICEPRKFENYEKLEDEHYRAEYGEDIEEQIGGFAVIKFFLENPVVKQYYPLLVTNTMTALNVVKGLAVNLSTSDCYRFAIVEFWKEFEAERTVDDHELILELRHKHVRSKQHFLFVYRRDLEKYEYIKDKELFFIHPEDARSKNAIKKQNGDPPFIQVWDPFFSRPNDPLASLPPVSSQASTPEKPVAIEDSSEAIVNVQVHSEESIVQFSKSPSTSPVKSPDRPSPSASPQRPQAATEPSSTVEASQEVEPPRPSTWDSDERPPSVFYVSDGSSDKSGSSQILDDSKLSTDDDLVNPIFCGTVFVKQGDRDYTLEEVRKMPNQKELARWSKKYLLLRNRKLYYVGDHNNMLWLYYMDEDDFRDVVRKRTKSNKKGGMLELIGPMSDYEVYTSIKARRHYNAPYGGSVYLRKHDGSLKKPLKIMFCPKPRIPKKNEEGSLDFSSKGRTLWVTALRLAKHGSKLKEGYQTHRDDLKEYEMKLRLMKDPRVPMDFTQGVGRIVLDAEEIEQIRREPKQSCSSERFDKYEAFPKQALEHGPHLTQKYYHGNLSRPESERLLRETYTNGAWLLRDSYARKNCLTLSYFYQCRVYHKYVTAASYHDQSTGQRIYVATLDQQLAFYDVHTLTEFYRLNKGATMLCMLGKSVKNEAQRDSSPPRDFRGRSPEPRPVPINLKASPSNPSPQSPGGSNKSPRSLKGFFSKSIQKSKQALKPKKLSLDAALPSTSKDEGSGALLIKQESLESPPASSQEPSSSGMSSGGPLTPDSPPCSSQEEQQPQLQPTSSKAPEA